MKESAEGASQQQRGLAELVDLDDPAWPIVCSWVDEARRPTVVLPVDRERAETALLALQVTTRSMLGTVAFESGGLLVDRGWLRILGSGHERLSGSLLSWNGLGPGAIERPLRGAQLHERPVIGPRPTEQHVRLRRRQGTPSRVHGRRRAGCVRGISRPGLARAGGRGW